MIKPTLWDRRFLELAHLVSTWSKDPSTKTGAVIVGPTKTVIAVGYNGFPRGMQDSQDRLVNREEKYSRTVHCEMNALLCAERTIPAGSTLYTYPFISCDRCVVHMLQAGIKTFVAPTPSADALTRWAVAFDKTRSYVKECGGSILEVDFSA